MWQSRNFGISKQTQCINTGEACYSKFYLNPGKYKYKKMLAFGLDCADFRAFCLADVSRHWEGHLLMFLLWHRSYKFSTAISNVTLGVTHGKDSSSSLNVIKCLREKLIWNNITITSILTSLLVHARQKRLHITEGRAFTCTECLKTFVVKSQLKAHLRIHEKERQGILSLVVRLFCPVSNENFTQILRTHLKYKFMTANRVQLIVKDVVNRRIALDAFK